jgi:hypothetical protein
MFTSDRETGTRAEICDPAMSRNADDCRWASSCEAKASIGTHDISRERLFIRRSFDELRAAQSSVEGGRALRADLEAVRTNGESKGRILHGPPA